MLHRLLILETGKNDERIGSIMHHARFRGVAPELVDRGAIERIVPHINHQGVCASMSAFPYADPSTLDTATGTMLALDHLQDPQNVGTLLRSAEAFGVSMVLIPADRAASITPAVVNASAGAVEHLSIVQVSNLAQELERAKRRGHWIVGVERRTTSRPLGATSIPTPCVLLIGSEGRGLGPNLIKRCDLLVEIEMRGAISSLNAATAGSIVLYEIARTNAQS